MLCNKGGILLIIMNKQLSDSDLWRQISALYLKRWLTATTEHSGWRVEWKSIAGGGFDLNFKCFLYWMFFYEVLFYLNVIKKNSTLSRQVWLLSFILPLRCPFNLPSRFSRVAVNYRFSKKLSKYAFRGFKALSEYFRINWCTHSKCTTFHKARQHCPKVIIIVLHRDKK